MSIGCAKDPQIVTRTETIRIKPPEALMAPREEPRMPEVPEGKLDVEDIVRWHDKREQLWKKAFEEAEADKKEIRRWAE